LHITKAEAGRRIDEAADLGQRRALTGESLAPQLTATAAAQRAGLVGDGHVKVIRSFFAHLPAEVDLSTREAAEADLADKASGYRPEVLAKYAQRIMDWLNPDGEFSDEERARKRGITMGKQEFDGMSRISGMVTPDLRAAIEAVLAKLAARGRATPTTRHRWSTRSRRTMRCAVTPAARFSATTTVCWLDCVACWRRVSWASTTDYPYRSL
jgi:hypothetical protein